MSDEKAFEQSQAINKNLEEQKKLPEQEKDKKQEEAKEKFEKNKTYMQVSISALAFLLSIASLLYTTCTNRETVERQQETQAYNYWQNFLQLAVQKPIMANGDDSKYYDTIQNDSVKRVEYAWFVASALGASEIVYRLQKNDEAWKSTLKEIISLHSKYINSGIDKKEFDTTHYSDGFYQLIKEAIKRKD